VPHGLGAGEHTWVSGNALVNTLVFTFWPRSQVDGFSRVSDAGRSGAGIGEVGRLLKTAFDEVSEETLSAASTVKVPSADGTLSGVINFLAYHDTYHTGQVAFLRCWLGHEGVAG